MTRLRTIIAGMIAATGLALGAVHAPASATSFSVPSPVPSGKHCVETVLDYSEPAEVACFATFADATAYATDGALQLPKGAKTYTSAQLEAAYARAAAAGIVVQQVVIGVSYDRTGYDSEGATRQHERTSSCDNDSGREHFGDLPDEWNDRISSARGLLNCTGRYYENTLDADTGWGATRLTNWSGGAMSNEASFIEWF